MYRKHPNHKYGRNLKMSPSNRAFIQIFSDFTDLKSTWTGLQLYDDCGKCHDALRVVKDAPEEMIKRLEMDIDGQLFDNFCNNHDLFPTFKDEGDCRNFVKFFVPKVVNWFQRFMAKKTDADVCQKYCSV